MLHPRSTAGSIEHDCRVLGITPLTSHSLSCVDGVRDTKKFGNTYEPTIPAKKLVRGNIDGGDDTIPINNLFDKTKENLSRHTGGNAQGERLYPERFQGYFEYAYTSGVPKTSPYVGGSPQVFDYLFVELQRNGAVVINQSGEKVAVGVVWKGSAPLKGFAIDSD